jgi:hypothetical protein
MLYMYIFDRDNYHNKIDLIRRINLVSKVSVT